jgi:hypothetical protein
MCLANSFEIWRSRGHEYEYCCVLGRDVVQSGRNLLTLRRYCCTFVHGTTAVILRMELHVSQNRILISNILYGVTCRRTMICLVSTLRHLAVIPDQFAMATDIRTEPLEEPIAAKLLQQCKSPIYPAASVRVFPSGCAHTAYFPKYAERFRNFKIREDDLWVVSYPKCGKRKRSEVAMVQKSTLGTSVICVLREPRNFIISNQKFKNQHMHCILTSKLIIPTHVSASTSHLQGVI